MLALTSIFDMLTHAACRERGDEHVGATLSRHAKFDSMCDHLMFFTLLRSGEHIAFTVHAHIYIVNHFLDPAPHLSYSTLHSSI